MCQSIIPAKRRHQLQRCRSHDTHSAVFAAENAARHSDGSAYLGSFSLSAVTEANGGGSLQWQFDVDNADLQSLAAGQAWQQFYDVTIKDGHGGDVQQTVTITVTGTNDAPVLTASAPTLTTIPEDQTAPVGTSVAGLLGSHVTDVDPERCGASRTAPRASAADGILDRWQRA